MSEKARIYIIDDHDVVRFGLSMLINNHPAMQVVGSAANLGVALADIDRLAPDLVVSDLTLEDSRGLDTVRAVVAAQLDRPTLFVSMHEEEIYARQAIALGARGFLMKDKAQENVVAAAQAILGGNIWISQKVSNQLLGRLVSVNSRRSEQPEVSALSARELEVLEKVGGGLTTKQIAFDLGLSPRTIDIHRARIKHKLGIKSGSELIAYAVTHLN